MLKSCKLYGRQKKKTLSHRYVRQFLGWAEGLIASVFVKRIPSHQGILKDEVADQLAFEVLDQITDTEIIDLLTIASAERKAGAMATILCRDW